MVSKKSLNTMKGETVNKIIAIIQARMGSVRLPGKVMLEIFDRPILWHVHHRLMQSKKITDILIATSDEKENDLIRDFCNKYKIKCFSGSESDVLLRYIEAAKSISADENDLIVRITADCPLIDPRIVDKVILKHISSQFDYTSNVIKPTYPDGLDVEVFSFRNLKKINDKLISNEEREHVTLHFRKNPNQYSLQNVSNRINYSDLRWTLDQKEDFKFIELIYEKLKFKKNNFTMVDVLKILQNNPEISTINEKYKRRLI
jgi:spore coat polysaccharide biosynthesis protein SpsF